MKEWKLIQTEIFEKRFKKLIPPDIQIVIKKQIKKLKENPYTGKPLGYRFIREKKFKKWRIYYIIYEDLLIIFFIQVNDKKLQQQTIDSFKKKFKELKKELESIT